MASGSSWRGTYSRSARSRRALYNRVRNVRVRGRINNSKRYTRIDALPF